MDYIQEYDNYMNERKNLIMGGLAITLWANVFFQTMKSDTRNLNFNDFENYIEKAEVNSDTNVIKIKDQVKADVMKNTNISNKQEVIKMLDSTMILKSFNTSNRMEKLFKRNLNKNTKAYFQETGLGPIIFLVDGMLPATVRHEYNHVVDQYAKVNNNIDSISNLFDFTRTNQDIKISLNRITDGNKTFTSRRTHFFKNSNDLKYLSKPTEIIVRIKNLRHFLYEDKMIKSPNSEIDLKLIEMIYNGDVYRKLPKYRQDEFLNSD